jgi:hypothetical protein
VQKLATSDLWIDRVSAAKGLGSVANSTLVRLHTILSDAKKRFGRREKLITAILELEKRVKDAGYRTRLEQYPLPRLLDTHAAADRRAKKPTKALPAKKAKKAPAEAKPAAAKAAAKKPAGAKKAPSKKSAKA